MTSQLYLPGTEVIARGLKWEVVETLPMGEQTRVRLRGTGPFAGFEVDVLTPFEPIEPLVHELDPEHAGQLPNWIVYHQAFLLEQALGPDAFLAVQPGRLRIEPYQLVPLARALRMTRPRLLLADDVGLGKTVEAGLIIAALMARRRVHRLLIVTPAGPLLEQWQTEMLDRFGLRLETADRAALDRIRRGVLRWPVVTATLMGLAEAAPEPLALTAQDLNDPEPWRIAFATGCASPLEYRCLEVLEQAGLTPVKQYAIRDGSGLPFTVADFAFPDQRVAISVDGVAFHTGDRLRRDRAIEERLQGMANPWKVFRVTANDVYQNHPGLVARLQATVLP